MKFVILNDTRDQPHFGCHRVMRTIERLLESRGAVVIGTALAGTRWERNPYFLNALRESDAILINGEGTLHHGHARAERLLQVVDHPLRSGKPVSIINALYQANPPEWSRYLNKMELIVARDGKSYREITGVYGGTLLKTLDLSLYEPSIATAGERSRISFGDSVYPQITRQLLMLSEAMEGTSFLPIMRTIKSRKAGLPLGLRKLRDAYVHIHTLAFQRLHPSVHISNDEFEFFNVVARSRAHITGRFHGACLSILADTPFLAVASNSWKIDALLDDLGLSQRRAVRPEDLEAQNLCDAVSDYSQGERRRMTVAISESRRTVEHAFDSIVMRSR